MEDSFVKFVPTGNTKRRPVVTIRFAVTGDSARFTKAVHFIANHEAAKKGYKPILENQVNQYIVDQSTDAFFEPVDEIEITYEGDETAVIPLGAFKSKAEFCEKVEELKAKLERGTPPKPESPVAAEEDEPELDLEPEAKTNAQETQAPELTEEEQREAFKRELAASKQN